MPQIRCLQLWCTPCYTYIQLYIGESSVCWSTCNFQLLRNQHINLHTQLPSIQSWSPVEVDILQHLFRLVPPALHLSKRACSHLPRRQQGSSFTKWHLYPYYCFITSTNSYMLGWLRLSGNMPDSDAYALPDKTAHSVAKGIYAVGRVRHHRNTS